MVCWHGGKVIGSSGTHGGNVLGGIVLHGGKVVEFAFGSGWHGDGGF